MFSAVEMILTKVSKNREKNRRQAEGGTDSISSSDTGTTRRRRRQEEKKRYSSSENSSSGGSNSDDCSSGESSDSSSRVRKRKESRKAGTDRKKKPDGRSERKKSTASAKSRTSRSGRERKISDTDDRSLRNEEGLKQEPEVRMSRRYKSEELLDVAHEESPKLTRSSRAISSLSLKEDQERKVKQKQIFMELKRKQEKERKDQLAEQRRMKQQKEQQELMNTISHASNPEEGRSNLVSEINQTQFRSTSRPVTQIEHPTKNKKLHEKEWKETSLDSESSEAHSKKNFPVVPPKPRKKPNDNQSSDSLSDFSSRENLVDNIISGQRNSESTQRLPQTSGPLQNNQNARIQSQLQTNHGGFSNTASYSDKISPAVGHATGKERSTGNPFSQVRGGYYSSSMPRTQPKGQSLVFPRPYQPPQNTAARSSTAWNPVKMGYQSDQAKRNSGVVYQVPNHATAVFPYNGVLRGSPTPSNQTIGDFRRNEVSRTINYGHLAQQRSDLV